MKTKSSSANAHQPEFDFDRADQLALLDSVPIKSGHVTEGKRMDVPVKGSTALNVLRRIDAYSRKLGFSWVGAERLAHQTGLSSRTIRRAIKLLSQYEYLIVESPNGKTLRCRINWGELSLQVAKSRAVESTTSADTERGHFFAKRGHSDTERGHSDTKRGHYVRRKVENPKKGTLSPPTPSNLPTRQAGNSWERVASEIVGAGVREWVRVLDFLKTSVTPDHAIAIVRVYRHREGAYGVVALYARLMRAHPEVPPEDGWPDPMPNSQWAKAENIRRRISIDAKRHDPNIAPSVIAAVTVDRLEAAGMGAMITDQERALSQNVERVHG